MRGESWREFPSAVIEPFARIAGLKTDAHLEGNQFNTTLAGALIDEL